MGCRSWESNGLETIVLSSCQIIMIRAICLTPECARMSDIISLKQLSSFVLFIYSPNFISLIMRTSFSFTVLVSASSYVEIISSVSEKRSINIKGLHSVCICYAVTWYLRCRYVHTRNLVLSRAGSLNGTDSWICQLCLHLSVTRRIT